MAKIDVPFHHKDVEIRSLEPIPPGAYLAEIIGSEDIYTKDHKGQMVKLTFKIVSDAHEGRLIFEHYLYKHETELAQQIGRQRLAEVCTATSIQGPLEDTEILHGVPVKVIVVIEADKNGQYPPRNTIKRVLPADAPLTAPIRTDNGSSTSLPSGISAPWRK